MFGLSRCEPGRLASVVGNMMQDADVLFFITFLFYLFIFFFACN